MTTPQITVPDTPPDPLAPQPTFRDTFYNYLKSLVVAFTETNAGFLWVAARLLETEAARDLAENYAQRAEDSAIPDVGGYSALHYAAKTDADRTQTGLDRTQTGLDAASALVSAAAAQAAAGLPAMAGNARRGLRVNLDEDGVEFASLGGLVPIAKYEVTTPVAALEFTLPSEYTRFRIQIESIAPETSLSDLYMRTSDDAGMTFDDSADYDYAQFSISPGLSITNGSSDDADQIAITRASYGVSNPGYFSADIELSNVGASEITRMLYHACYSRDSVRPVDVRGSAARLAADKTDAIQLLFSSGNIESGVVHVYGYNDGDA